MEAQVEDEELAELIKDQESAPKERWSEWSPERVALARLEDAVRENTLVLVRANGGKPGAFKPAPRPVTAVQRVRERDRRREHNRIAAILVPPGRGEEPVG